MFRCTQRHCKSYIYIYKKLRSVKAFKRVIIKHSYVLDFTKGCQRKNCAQDKFDSASSNDVSSLINSISKTRQSNLFCTVWGPIISRDSWFLDRLTLLLFFLVLKCFNKQLTTASVKKVVVSSLQTHPSLPPFSRKTFGRRRWLWSLLTTKP